MRYVAKSVKTHDDRLIKGLVPSLILFWEDTPPPRKRACQVYGLEGEDSKMRSSGHCNILRSLPSPTPRQSTPGGEERVTVPIKGGEEGMPSAWFVSLVDLVFGGVRWEKSKDRGG